MNTITVRHLQTLLALQVLTVLRALRPGTPKVGTILTPILMRLEMQAQVVTVNVISLGTLILILIVSHHLGSKALTVVVDLLLRIRALITFTNPGVGPMVVMVHRAHFLILRRHLAVTNILKQKMI